jgi:hypothetical protein
MARRQVDVIDIVEVLQHWHAGRPEAVASSLLVEETYPSLPIVSVLI